MKRLIFTLFFALICVNSFAQTGKEEYDKAMNAVRKSNHKKANNLFLESCKKGYDSACITLAYQGSGLQRSEARKIGAERGNPECMFLYGIFNIDDKENANSSLLKPFATSSITEAYDYVVKAITAGYEPAYFYMGKKAEEAGDIASAIQIYQHLADKGDKKIMYKVAILKKDPRTAFAAAKDAGISDYEIYKSADKSDDPKYVFETAKIFDEKGDKTSSGFLYANACDLGNGEACYLRGLDYLSDYRDHENGLKFFDNAIKYGYKVPEKTYLRMKNPASAEDIKQVDAKLQAQYEESARYAKNHPNGNEPEYKENKVYTKTKKSLTQADMDNIIKNNSTPTKSNAADDAFNKNVNEALKQSDINEKKIQGTYRGY